MSSFDRIGRDYRLGLALVLSATVIGSTAGLFTRLISADTASMVFWRGIFGAIGIGIFMALRAPRSFFADLARIGWPGFLYAVIAGSGNLFNLASLRTTTVAHNAIIFATLPFIAGTAAWVLQGERMKPVTTLASLAALGGVAVMVGLRAGEGSLLGDGLALAFTLAIATIMLMARQFRDVPMLPAALLSSLLGVIPVVPFAHVISATSADIVGPALFGLVNLGLGFALFVLGSRLLPPAETGLIFALDAPLAPIWVLLLLGETPGPATFVGGAIVFAAVALNMLHNLRTTRTAGAPAGRPDGKTDSN
jgi:drug/metabolite transporter (DMT)-like permease